MLPKSHVRIAKKIIENSNEDIKSIINNNTFIYGNILPDDKRFKKIYSDPHYYEPSREFLFYLIGGLLEMKKIKDVKNDKYIEEVSIKLGIVNHFLTDYFCYFHNMEYMLQYKTFKLRQTRKWYLHYMYERKVNGYLRKNYNKIDFTAFFDEKLIEKEMESLKNIEDLKSYLVKKINLYKKERNTPLTDIRYCLVVCYVFDLFIMNYLL